MYATIYITSRDKCPYILRQSNRINKMNSYRGHQNFLGKPVMPKLKLSANADENINISHLTHEDTRMNSIQMG
jgi:hypothetical protein